MTIEQPPDLDLSFFESADSPCGGGGCDEVSVGEQTENPITQSFNRALFNAVDLCFDEVRKEPKKILMVGGCRQRAFAQHIALLLPAPEIVLVDPDPEECRKAQEEICCRFKFVSAQLDELPFENGDFDLTFAHNVFEFTEPNHWQSAIDELYRVTESSGNLMLSVHRPALWNMLGWLPGLKPALQGTGITLPKVLPNARELYDRLELQADVADVYAPFPWQVYMTNLKPANVREERSVLAPV